MSNSFGAIGTAQDRQTGKTEEERLATIAHHESQGDVFAYFRGNCHACFPEAYGVAKHIYENHGGSGNYGSGWITAEQWVNPE